MNGKISCNSYVLASMLLLGACTPWQLRMEPYTGAIPRSGTPAQRAQFFAELKQKPGPEWIKAIEITEEGQRVTVVGEVKPRKDDDPEIEKTEYLFAPEDATGQTLQAVVITLKDPTSTYDFQELSPNEPYGYTTEMVAKCGDNILTYMWVTERKSTALPIVFGMLRPSAGVRQIVVTEDLPWFIAHAHCEPMADISQRLAKLRLAGDFAAWNAEYSSLISRNDFALRALSKEHSEMQDYAKQHENAAAQKAYAEKQVREQQEEAAAESRAAAAWAQPTVLGTLPVYVERARAGKRRGSMPAVDVARGKAMEDLLQKALAAANAEQRPATAAGYAALLQRMRQQEAPTMRVDEGALTKSPATPLEQARVGAAKLAAAIVPVLVGSLDPPKGGKAAALDENLAMDWPLNKGLDVLCKNLPPMVDGTGQTVLKVVVTEPVSGELRALPIEKVPLRRLAADLVVANPAHAKWLQELDELNHKVASLGGQAMRLKGEGNNARYVEANVATEGSYVRTSRTETDQSLQNRQNAALGKMMANSELRSAEGDLRDHVARQPEKTHRVEPKSPWEVVTVELQGWRGKLHRVLTLSGGGIERKIVQDYPVEWSDRHVDATPGHPAEGSMRSADQLRADVHRTMDGELLVRLLAEQGKLVSERLVTRAKSLPATWTPEQRAEEMAWSRYLLNVLQPADAELLKVRYENMVSQEGN